MSYFIHAQIFPKNCEFPQKSNFTYTNLLPQNVRILKHPAKTLPMVTAKLISNQFTEHFIHCLKFPNCKAFHLFCKIARFFATEQLFDFIIQ
jgi:hypothetical protein